MLTKKRGKRGNIMNLQSEMRKEKFQKEDMGKEVEKHTTREMNSRWERQHVKDKTTRTTRIRMTKKKENKNERKHE